jgi:hypothetical protein
MQPLPIPTSISTLDLVALRNTPKKKKKKKRNKKNTTTTPSQHTCFSLVALSRFINATGGGSTHCATHDTNLLMHHNKHE